MKTAADYVLSMTMKLLGCGTQPQERKTMKLEELLGPELFKQVQEKIDAANAGKEDKLTHIRYADLSEGGYVSKGKYDDLSAEHETNVQKLSEANELIKQLQKAAKGDETLQQQITTYQGKIAELEADLQQTRIDSAVKVALLSEGAEDIDYLTYKLKEKGETLELDEQGNIKGWNEKLEALKTQLPGQFQSKGGNGNYDGFRPLEKDGQKQQTGMTKAELLKKSYAERMKLFNENPDAYNEIMKG